jgi:hypothetical protein
MSIQRLVRASLIFYVAAFLLASTMFVSSARRKAAQEGGLPPEVDVRAPGGVLRGGALPGARAAQAGAKAEAAPAAAQGRTPDAAEAKALRSLEAGAGGRLDVEYNHLTGTPRHMFAADGYLTKPSADAPEKVALDFVRRWQGVFRFGDEDVEGLRLKSRAQLPDLGVTTLLYEQQVEGVPVYKGEVLVNVNRAGQIVNVGGDSYPQLKVTNSMVLTPAEAVSAAAASLGFEGFTPQPAGTKMVPRSFGNLDPDPVEAPRFSGGKVFTGEIVVTHVIFPLGAEGRHAYDFVLTTPQYRGIMWNNLVDAETGEVLRRTSLTAFFGTPGGGPVNSRRATFRPDVQDLVESHNPAGTAQGQVFDGMPVALSGRRLCSGNVPGRPCNGAAGTGGTTGIGYGRSPARGTPPAYQPNENEFDRNNGRGFKKSLVLARVEDPFADTGGALFPSLFDTPFGQVTRGFPDALNPSPSSRFGWFYLPTGTGGTEIPESDNNRASTRAFKYEMPDEAKARNRADNSPAADKSQPFAADLTALASSITLRDGRVLSSVFQSRYTEGNNVIVADDRADDDETTSGVKGYSANRQFTAPHFTFANSYEYGGVDAFSYVPNTITPATPKGEACQVVGPCVVFYPTSSDADVYPDTVSLFYYTNLMHDYLQHEHAQRRLAAAHADVPLLGARLPPLGRRPRLRRRRARVLPRRLEPLGRQGDGRLPGHAARRRVGRAGRGLE